MTTSLPYSPDRPLKIATRASPLALAQAYETRDRLQAAHGWPAAAVEIVAMTTTGDQRLEKKLGEIGGKGLFIKEIEEALASGAADVAAHSMKDAPTEQPPGLEIVCLLPREDPRDAFVSLQYDRVADLPHGATVGTASLRRQAQLMRARPDLNITLFRGNVQTRLRKLEAGDAAATFLAVAGLNRLDLAHVAREILDPWSTPPALAQGAIGLEIRSDDAAARAALAPLHCPETAICLACERAFLAALDGSCRTPMGGLAVLTEDGLQFAGEVLRPDGSDSEREEAVLADPTLETAQALGHALGERIKERIGPDYMT